MSFHRDCWVALHQQVQADYADRVAESGVDGLLTPYTRAAMACWLPQGAIDLAAENLTDRLAEELLESGAVASAPVVADPGEPAVG